MRVRVLVVWLAMTLALAGSVLPSRASEVALAPASQAVAGVAAGGGYRVVVQPAAVQAIVARHVIGALSGGQYRLSPTTGMSPAATAVMPASSQAGCCCAYLPCVKR